MLHFLKGRGFVNLLWFYVIKVQYRQKAWVLFTESSTKVSVNFKLENTVAVSERGLLRKSYNSCAPGNSTY